MKPRNLLVIMPDEHSTKTRDCHGSTLAHAFMARIEEYKYLYYVACPPQLFDPAGDPEELTDLADDPAYDSVRREAHGRLRSLCGPEAVDAAARRRQSEPISLNGGREAAIARGDLGFSVPPGVEPMFD